MKLAYLLLPAIIAASVPAAAQVHVRGHFRKDGTYVQPHVRSAPDSSRSNNWSSQGNYNPYTGQQGTVNPYRAPSVPTYRPYTPPQSNTYQRYSPPAPLPPASPFQNWRPNPYQANPFGGYGDLDGE